MTMYRMRQRRTCSRWLARRSRCATCCSRVAGRTATPSSRCTRTRSRRSRRRSRTTCSRSSSSSSATAGACRRRTRRPTAARSERARSRGPGSRSTASSPATCWGSTARRATPTAASRRWTTCCRTSTAAAVLLTGLGRLVQDLLAWCTVEFGYMRLGDGFVQGSSIMPQKRNPVALEHARAHLQQGARARRLAVIAGGAQHAVRRHRGHGGRPAAARGVRCSATRARRLAGRGGHGDRRRSTRAARGAGG